MGGFPLPEIGRKRIKASAKKFQGRAESFVRADTVLQVFHPVFPPIPLQIPE